MKGKRHTPPRMATRILQRLIRQELAEEVLGDLEEKFLKTLKATSLLLAKLNYWYQVFNYLRPFAIKKTKIQDSNTVDMFAHNLVLIFRHFRKQSSHFLINLVGLSAGLACVLFIFLWVQDELEVDQFHMKRDRLYQIMSNHSDASGIFTWKGVPGLLYDELQAQVPEIESATITTDAHEYTLSVAETYHKANGKFANRDFFKVFSFQLMQGDPKQVLADPSSIVISESLAKRLFKTKDALGKSITWHFWGKTKTVKVTGILKDIPEASSEQFDYLMSWDYYHDELISFKNWFNYYARIMVVLRGGADKIAVQEKIDKILKERQERENVSLFLTPYAELYLHSQYENGLRAGGRIDYVHLFIIVAVFILFIASVNFINLSTAKASFRTKEIGIKKTMGASRQSIAGQYFTESILLTFISLLIAILSVWLLLPQFNFIAQKHLSIEFTSEFVLALIALVILVGFVAGSYPALHLSGFNVIEVIKGKLAKSKGDTWSRKTLVISQFTLSIILIVAVVIVYLQMDFIQSRNLGYDKENLVYFEREGKLIDNYQALLNELNDLPGVHRAAVSGFMVGGGNSTGGVDWEGKTPEDQIQFWEIRSGDGVLEMMDMKMVNGRTFSSTFKSDTNAVIFNETAISAMGLKDPIGKTIRHYTGDKKIVGVVKDFNLLSLHTAVEPTIFLYTPEQTHFVMAKLEKGAEISTLAKMEDLYHSFNPGYVFKPQFVDQDYKALYAAEERVAILSKYFAGFAILISCMGLFALAAFTAEKRFKEIGIRKALGAGTVRIMMLLSKDFGKMVLIAILLGLPVSYFMASRWLSDFAFRIDLKWWYFLGAGMITLTVAMLTVALQTVKAASVNPVQSLRDE
ncbi:MAG: ABC transporter permease [Cyclobacteriaceae bacterium]|nr:ABC transporter permease [Cyclobacteriaceae bacterium HetDA_MAG_MS6]